MNYTYRSKHVVLLPICWSLNILTSHLAYKIFIITNNMYFTIYNMHNTYVRDNKFRFDILYSSVLVFSVFRYACLFLNQYFYNIFYSWNNVARILHFIVIAKLDRQCMVKNITVYKMTCDVHADAAMSRPLTERYCILLAGSLYESSYNDGGKTCCCEFANWT